MLLFVKVLERQTVSSAAKGLDEMAVKILMLVVFFGIMVAIGFYCRKHATDVNGFVLGGRNVGPWLTAFA